MERLIQFACVHDPITLQDLEIVFGLDVKDWLNTNHANVLDNLKAFAHRTIVDKQNTLAHFQNDRTFTTHLTDPGYRFQLHNPARNDDVKIWLVHFYDQLKATGFHPLVCNHNDYFRDKDWWESFSNANPTQTMCVACDGSMNHGRTIEHYFPKSIYPALSIHPANLIPLCDKCNNDKGNVDPLDGTTIDLIFIPYYDNIDQVIDLDFSPTAAGNEQIQLRTTATDPKLPLKMQRYSQLFSIPTQWNKNMHEIANIGITTLHQQLRGMRRAGIIIGKSELMQLIDNVCADMEKDWGNAHYFYPATKWLLWAKQNKFNALCEGLGVV